jgi:hypothetical protein
VTHTDPPQERRMISGGSPVHMVATESALLGQFCWISWTGISVRDPIAHLEKPAHPSAPPLTPQLCGGLLGKRRVGQERGKSRAKPFVLWCTLPRASAHCSEGYGCRGLPLPGGGEAASPWGWGGCLSLGVGRLCGCIDAASPQGGCASTASVWKVLEISYPYP